MSDQREDAALAEIGRLAFLTFAHGTEPTVDRWERLPEDFKRYWQERGCHFAALTRDNGLLESVTRKPLMASEWWCDAHRLRTSQNPCCANARVTEWSTPPLSVTGWPSEVSDA